VAQKEVRHAVTIHHRRAQAAGSRVDKATTLPGHWAIGFGSYERSTQAQEEVMSFDSQRFLAAQEAVYDQVVEELSQGRKTTHWIWFVFPQITGLGRSERAITQILGSVDAQKFYSCITLFHLADPAAECFKRALEIFFQGSLDQGTLALLDTD
jgi:uncharacterized protein (DUF1810 family)